MSDFLNFSQEAGQNPADTGQKLHTIATRMGMHLESKIPEPLADALLDCLSVHIRLRFDT